MTEHNRTWSEELYYGEDDTPDTTDEEDHDHYWDYPEDY